MGQYTVARISDYYAGSDLNYLVDVRKGKGAVSSLLEFAVFACFFPTQVAGPIKRFVDFVPQIRRVHHFQEAQFGSGLGLFCWARHEGGPCGQSRPSGGAGLWSSGCRRCAGVANAWLAVIAFAFQICFDFSGFSGSESRTGTCKPAAVGTTPTADFNAGVA
jgi:alginate O-acetyltransferase complex protein AlgI